MTAFFRNRVTMLAQRRRHLMFPAAYDAVGEEALAIRCGAALTQPEEATARYTRSGRRQSSGNFSPSAPTHLVIGRAVGRVWSNRPAPRSGLTHLVLAD